MALSPDDKVLVTGTGYSVGSIGVWDAATGKRLARMEGHTGFVTDLAFSPDGRHLASSANEPVIRLWETTHWTETRVLRGHGVGVYSVAFSPDGNMLASGGVDGTVLLWDLAPRQSPYGYRPLPAELTFAGETTPGLVYGRVGQAATLLRLDDFRSSPLALDTNLLTFFLPPHFAAVYDETNTLGIFEIRNAALQPVKRLPVGNDFVVTPAATDPGSGVPAIAHNPEQRLIAWSGEAGMVHVTKLDSTALSWQWSSEFNPPVPQTFSDDGGLLALIRARPAQGVEVREVKTGKLVLRSDIIEREPRVRYGILTRTLFANGGRRFVAAGSDLDGMQVLMWDLTQPGTPPKRFSERGGMRGLSVSPDGKWVAAGTDAQLVILYDATTMERRAVLPGSPAANNLRFSPDSRVLATAGRRTEGLKLWQLETGQELISLPSTGRMNSVAFTENADSILVGTIDRPGAWQIWRAPSWDVINATEAKEKAESKQP